MPIRAWGAPCVTAEAERRGRASSDRRCWGPLGWRVGLVSTAGKLRSGAGSVLWVCRSSEEAARARESRRIGCRLR